MNREKLTLELNKILLLISPKKTDIIFGGLREKYTSKEHKINKNR